MNPRNKSIISALQMTHLINPSHLDAAPLLDLQQEESSTLFNRSLPHCYQDLIKVAEDSGMAIGITDHQGTLHWTWSSQPMRSSAEQVHFVKGGHWSTQAVGTNAIGLALNQRTANCVYSHENHMNSVRDWVCYAAPILDPQSGQCHGILNLSTKYQKHNALGLLAVEHCAAIVQRAIHYEQQHVLYLNIFGTPRIQFNAQPLNLSYRQIEILCILALCPNGIHLDELHYALYGERQVSVNTLKAELSQLRGLMPDCIQSRPYQLRCELQCDFLNAEGALDAGLLASTFALYKGSFLAKSESPFLSAWRDCFDARLSHIIYQIQDIDLLFKLISRIPDRIDAAQRLLELLPSDSPQRAKVIRFLA